MPSFKNSGRFHPKRHGIWLALLALLLLVAGPFGPRAAAGGEPDSSPGQPVLAQATVQGTGEVVTYEVVDDLAIIDHDIILGHHDEVQEHGVDLTPLDAAPDCPEDMQCGVIDARTRRAWPGGVVPYTIPQGTSSSAVDSINAAIAHWEEKTSISFVRRSDQPDYVAFVGTGSGNSCSSYVGRIGGQQPIYYSGNGRGCLVHEIGHAVGLSHEHSRNDRDDHITIDYTNIVGGGNSNFRKATGSVDIGSYDFGSVMHYSAFAFARDRSRPVIVPKDPNIPLSAVGGRGVLTASDVQAVEYVYGSGNPPPPPPPTTTTAPPTTTTTAPPTTTAPTTTTAPPTTAPTTTTAPPTTTAPTTTTAPPTTTAPTTTTAPPTTAPTTAPPTTETKPAVAFIGLADGDTVDTRIPYGGLSVTAYDADVGTENGDGIHRVTMVLRDSETGRWLGARSEYWAPYEWGLRLRPGRTYTLEAYAISKSAAGGGWSMARITITAGR